MGITFASTLWLIWVSWPRHPQSKHEIDLNPSKAGNSSQTATSDTLGNVVRTEVQEASETALMIFFLDYIAPAVRALHKLQRVMIHDAQSNNGLIAYTIGWIKARSKAVEELWRSFDYLNDAFCSSPQEPVPLNRMIDHIAKIEVYYGYLRGQTDDVASKLGINYSEKYPSDWEEWHIAHTALKTAYDSQIKRSRKFGRLFRPGRESRWGDVHMPLPLDG